MRKTIWEYLIPSTEEKKNLWDNCVFVFDTNVLLNLYRYTSNTRDTLLAALDNLKERVWLPHQVAFEFAKNRCDVIFETVEKYKGLEKKKQEFVSSIATELRLKTSDEPVVELEKYVEAWLAKQQEKNLLVTQASDDRILDKVLSIFDGKVGTAFTEEEHTKLSEEGKKRYEKQIPPGFCDQKKEKDGHENNEYGDLIVWKQIMLYSASNKVNIIYVTHDQKRDWWNSAKGRTIGPRIELRKEFSDTTGQEFYMYSMDSFLEQYAHHEGLVTDPSVFVEISEIDIQTNRKKRKKQATTLYEYSLVLEKNLVNLQERISRRQRTIDNIKMKYQGKALPS